MMLTSRSFVALLAMVCAAGCSAPSGNDGNEGEKTGNSAQAIDELIEGIDDMPVDPPQQKTEIDCDGFCPEPGQDGDQYCSYKRFTETARFDKFVAFQPNSATLWPGAVVRGADAQLGILTPVAVELAPRTFSVSLENLGGSPVGHMDAPSLSNFRDERNRILGQDVTGATPASLDFEIKQVHSESELSLALGAGVSWPGGGMVAGSFDFTSSDKQTKIVVDFTQAYYTIDIDTPTHPHDFFDPSVTVDDLEKYVAADSPPLYVQSITYGRRVIFSVETDDSADAVKAALEATYASAVNVNAKVSAEQKLLLQKSDIKAFVIGGSGADATGVVAGFDGLMEYIKKGGDYSKDSPGAPIAYKLAYLTNVVTQLAFTTEYMERTCVKNLATLRIELAGMSHLGGNDVGGNIELYGNIGLRYPTKGSNVVSCSSGGAAKEIWNTPEGSWISFPELTTWAPSSPIVLYVHDVPIDGAKNLCLFGHLWEEDYSTGELSPDDDFGSKEMMVSYKDGWAGEQVLQIRGKADEAVDVKVKIEVQ